MPQQLSDPARRTAVRALRVMFPHDGLPDEAYEKVALAIPVEDDGLERWLGRLDPDEVAEAEGSDEFELLRSTAVVELYDNPAVWKAFGYEGPSVHLGGYVSRGFDDLDWLPDPPIHRQEA
jgi:hypothetical protein